MTQANEKYKGDALLQKKHTVDFLTKKQKINEGEVPQYYVENSHPAIIQPEVFDIVQHELKRRKALGAFVKNKGVLQNRLICGDCGGFFGAKQWHSDGKYARVVWQCRHRYQGEAHCQTGHLTEEAVKEAFVEVWNGLIENRDTVLETCEALIFQLIDNTALNQKHQQLQAEYEVLLELMQRCIRENANTALDQEEYRRRYEELSSRFEAVKADMDALDTQRTENGTKASLLRIFLTTLRQQPQLLTTFDASAWYAIVDTVIVHRSGALTFKLKDGTEIPYNPA